MGINILHQAQGFILAELPQIEQGVKHLISISADNRAILHRVLSTGEMVSQEMNLPLLKSIIEAANLIVG